MPVYQIAPPGEDGTDSDDTATLMYAKFTNVLSPPVSSVAHTRWDLSAYSGTITAARLRIYGDSYTATRGVSKNYDIIWVDNSSSSTQYNMGGFVYSAAGVVWHDLLNYDKIKFNYDNIIRVTVPDPGATKQRSFAIRTSEYSVSPDTDDPMLELTFASGETVFVSLVG